MATVALDRLRKVYPDGHVAVAGASFEVADGELLVLVGPSGCGKSTLLRMIAGLESISDGRLSIDGREVNEVAPKDRDIAMVFQSYALYPHMTVAENLGFGLTLRGHPKAEIAQRIEAAADMLELRALLQRRPGALSGGQRQRVALGRALVRQPKVFLLDEPLSNLDAKLRASMRTEIARIHRNLAATMVYVTHDQVEAMTLGQRIVVMRDGEIQQIDTPMALYRAPANAFVATFLGSPAMNLLRGVLAETDGGHRLALPDGRSVPLSGLGTSSAGTPLVGMGHEVEIGIRPEHLLRCGPNEEADFEAELEVIEPIGSEAFAYLRFGAHSLVARFAPEDLPQPGSTLRLRIAHGHVHVFDGADGRRL
ncbi:MAG: sn-glycerol-3-phosphate ABC transporter ATP-binding protein UgpC [Xanthomonadaceae bacterium]|nr:sn-glycerol-3-phosphate ABC transporter ATP-binding protein UgpC [Xanthomonadaceae bacterium]